MRSGSQSIDEGGQSLGASGVFRISVRRGRRARRRRRELGVVEGAGPLPPQNNFCPQSDKFGCILP